MTGQILMPKLGLTMTEGLVTEWHVEAGGKVQAGDILFSVETEKIVTDIEAPATGEILEITVPEGETVPVGSVVAAWTGPTASMDYEAEDDEGGDALESGEQALPEQHSSPSADKVTGRVRVSPSARRMAKQHAIVLESVMGTGADGEIKLADIEREVAKTQSQSTTPDQAAARPENTSRPATRFEKIVAQRLTQSKQTIPHFYVQAHADVTDLIKRRSTHNQAAAPEERISFNDLVIFGLGRAFAQSPEANSIWQNETIECLSTVDIGMAVNTERGLFVPVLRDVSSISINALAIQARDMVARAKSGKLGPADMEGGAVTVSNVGMFGSVTLLPIINPGQSAILGVGAPQAVFRPDKDSAPELRHELPLALACDHRIYDGVMATRLMQQLCEVLARPADLLAE